MEVKPSCVQQAGLGVFATRPFLQGEPITIFGEGYRSWSAFDDYTIFDGCHGRYGRPWKGDIPAEVAPMSIPVGHLINDRCRLKPTSDMNTLSKLSRYIRIYTSTSRHCANVVIDPSTWTVHATRPIDIGDELYLHYGAWFWVHRCMLDTLSIDQKLTLYVYQTMTYPTSFVHGFLYLDGMTLKHSSTGRNASPECRHSFQSYFLRYTGNTELVELFRRVMT